MGEGGSIGLMGSRDEAYRFAISNSNMTRIPGLPCKGNLGSNREGMGSGTTCEEGSWRGSASQLNFCFSVIIHLWLGVSVLYTSHFLSTPSIITENLQRVCAVHLTWETTE